MRLARRRRGQGCCQLRSMKGWRRPRLKPSFFHSLLCGVPKFFDGTHHHYFDINNLQLIAHQPKPCMGGANKSSATSSSTTHQRLACPSKISQNLFTEVRQHHLSANRYLIIPKIHPFPDYFATLTFWGSEWCSGDSSCPLGCAPYSGGYQANIPPFIQSTLNIMPKIGISSRNLLLGLHAKGIDSNIITLVSANHTE